MIPRTFGLALFAMIACTATFGCKPKGTGTSPEASTSASASAGPTAAACPAGQVALDGPGICLAVPAGYTPLNKDNSKDKTGGSMQVNYSSDGTSGGKFVGTVNVTYNAAP